MVVVFGFFVGSNLWEGTIGKTLWSAEVALLIFAFCLPMTVRFAIFAEQLNKVMGWKRGFVGITSWLDRWIKHLHVKIGYKTWFRWIPLLLNIIILFVLWLNLTTG